MPGSILDVAMPVAQTQFLECIRSVQGFQSKFRGPIKYKDLVETLTFAAIV